jgi:hypothetical protein
VKDLDRRLAALGDLGSRPDLSGLESAVWTDVDARALRPMPGRVALTLSVVAALAASGAGAAAAAATARESPQSVFAIHPATAPSTILGG